jgi:hypothetical protein
MQLPASTATAAPVTKLIGLRIGRCSTGRDFLRAARPVFPLNAGNAAGAIVRPAFRPPFLKGHSVMNKDPAELARDCREHAALCNAETCAALHEMADTYDRMAARQQEAQDSPH